MERYSNEQTQGDSLQLAAESQGMAQQKCVFLEAGGGCALARRLCARLACIMHWIELYWSPLICEKAALHSGSYGVRVCFPSN